MKTARCLVYELLMKMEANAYSNLLLDHALPRSGLTAQDKKFASYLFYGIIERKITLDYIISQYSSKPEDKIQREIRQILRIGLYQLLYMDSVPDNAAVNESVALTKEIRMSSASGFVNAILRNFLRNGKMYEQPKEEAKRLSVQYSCPEPLLQQWIQDYGFECIHELLQNTVSRPPEYIRVNSVKTDENRFGVQFGDTLKLSPAKFPIPDAFILGNAGSVEENEVFRQGFFHVQDLSSQLCCMALAPVKGDVVLDVCAAPGGKTYTMAQLMQDEGVLHAFDLHPKRVALIQEGARRLGLHCIQADCQDAKKFNPAIPLADKILCDVPCAGFGVIAKKPEIKYKELDSLRSLPEIQSAILDNACRYLKPGGYLVYSTCSLSREENDHVVEAFLENHPEFEGVSFLSKFGAPFGSWKTTIFPGQFNSDGFFIAKLKRKK